MRQEDCSREALRCEECEREAKADSVGWLVFQVDLAATPDPPHLVVYRPECAMRELVER